MKILLESQDQIEWMTKSKLSTIFFIVCINSFLDVADFMLEKRLFVLYGFLNKTTMQQIIANNSIDCFPLFLKYEINLVEFQNCWSEQSLQALFDNNDFKTPSLSDSRDWWNSATQNTNFGTGPISKCRAHVLLSHPKMNDWIVKTDEIYENFHSELNECHREHLKMILDDPRIDFERIAKREVITWESKCLDLIVRHPRATLQFHCWILSEFIYRTGRQDALICLGFAAEEVAKCYVSILDDFFVLVDKQFRFSFQQLLEEMKNSLKNRDACEICQFPLKLTKPPIHSHFRAQIFDYIGRNTHVALAHLIFNKQFVDVLTNEQPKLLEMGSNAEGIRQCIERDSVLLKSMSTQMLNERLLKIFFRNTTILFNEPKFWKELKASRSSKKKSENFVKSMEKIFKLDSDALRLW